MARLGQGGHQGEGITPASVEVLAHHARLHRRDCQAPGYRQMTCPCGAAVAVVCACGTPLFVAVAEPGHPPCRHMRDLLLEAA